MNLLLLAWQSDISDRQYLSIHSMCNSLGNTTCVFVRYVTMCVSCFILYLCMVGKTLNLIWTRFTPNSQQIIKKYVSGFYSVFWWWRMFNHDWKKNISVYLCWFNKLWKKKLNGKLDRNKLEAHVSWYHSHGKVLLLNHCLS